MNTKRRTYITNLGLQMKVTLVFISISLMGSIIATIAFNYFAMKKLESLMWSTHISVKSTGELIGPLFLNVSIANIVFVSLLLVFGVIWMMKLKSGPLFRMNNDMKKITDGDLSINIILRQKDEFKDTAVELDNMVTKTRERFENIIDKHRDISSYLSVINDEKLNLQINYDSILENIGELEAAVDKFKI